ncbi:MAG: MCE family protein [Rhodopirellula sp.]|nr:MCE family protein [Rhodopirellula sp.]
MTNDAPQPGEPSTKGIPTAKITAEQSRFSVESLSTRMWVVTAAALVLSIGLAVWNQKPAGPTITIHFEQGHGLRLGNSVQHRGIIVGEVMSVELSSDEESVAVKVELLAAAKKLARAGSEFWVVRPRVSLSKVTGLDTVVGARYIEVQPGPPDSDSQFVFDGLETPLSLADSDAVEIEIRFENGDGLSIGDEVRHRGIVVGEVTSVDLNDDLTGVVVKIRLLSSAVRLARTGSQFWVERPTVSAVEVRGLETLVGGRYIAVQPGPTDAALSTSFNGLAKAPAGELPEGGVEITLEASQRGGLHRGVPVLFRGEQVGHVIAVALASDATTVDARVWIDAAYRDLVRDNTRFWMNSGIDVSVGLDGLKLSADTLSSIIVGGVSLATPSQPGAKISTGHRFPCAAEADDEWLTWQARIPIGSDQITGGILLPVPVRASQRWQERRFGFRRDKQRSGWILPLSDGRLLGPADLLMPDGNAIEGTTKLEAAGETVEIPVANVTRLGSLAIFSHRFSSLDPESAFPAKRLAHSAEPVDCLIVTAGSESVLSVTSSRFRVEKSLTGASDSSDLNAVERWLIDPGVPLNADYHGACVVSRADGHVVGVLCVGDAGSRVSLMPKPPFPKKSGSK